MKRRDFLRYGSMGMAGLTLGATDLSLLIKAAQAADTPWKFGVMADTQWGNSNGINAGTCAVGVINALNQEFIAHGCRFVVQVGDLVDVEGEITGDWFHWHWKSNLDARAHAAQALYDAGIGFYPVRGNHEATQQSAESMVDLFPQTRGNGNNFLGVDAVHGSNHSQLQGLSYAIDCENVRIILIDQFIRLNGLSLNINNNVVDQVGWVQGLLENRPSDMHAFVMAHKNLVGQSHDDCILGSGPGDNSSERNQLIGAMQATNAAYYMGGHDHMHHRSIVRSPDNTAAAEQIICASCSHKFYSPGENYGRETPVSQELYTIGYYIITVDGPCLTVDFYSSSHGQNYGDTNLSTTPTLDFFHRESFGTSLNGSSYKIDHGQYYDAVNENFEGTTAKIIAGANGNTETDKVGRQMTKHVKTGWKTRPMDAASAVFYLWGMNDNLAMRGSASQPLPQSDEPQAGDPYTLSMSYNPELVSLRALRRGAFGIKARTESGDWVNAVDLNSSGYTKFHYGPYSGQSLGAYGVDPRTETVWAVVDCNGIFVAK